MKTTFRTVLGILGVGSVLALATSQANAGCGDIPGQARPAAPTQPQRFRQDDQPRLMRVGYMKVDSEQNSATIVGLWKFTFVAQGNPSGPPDGTMVDFGYVTWHSDGTEITNSGGRPPQSGDFCMGVWKQTSAGTYKLNHYAEAWQADGSAYLGPANIKEDVAVNAGGTSYVGTFTIDQYDATGTTVLAHVGGTVSASRITVNGGGL